ncbi:MAG: CehA/McbA family metallohydrolase, partial [Planctomycetota bacterium]
MSNSLSASQDLYCHRLRRLFFAYGLTPLFLFGLQISFSTHAAADTLSGEIVDKESGKPVAARLYIRGPKSWHLAQSNDPTGNAVPSRKVRAGLSEIHTTLSAHPFTAELDAGEYSLVVERGKEYLPWTGTVKMPSPKPVRIELQRFANLAEQGWYSGETHVHRKLSELPTLMMAEDLNVAFPLTSWETRAYRSPRLPEGTPDQLIRLDDTHVIWPRNTEYEIFTVDGKQHTLGAFFILGHKKPYTLGLPPIEPVAGRAVRGDALIELDKHNWEWSMAIIPILDVDLYELANNHVWRVGFGFPDWAEKPAKYMNIEYDAKGKLTEWGWIDFGFQNYYALLNSGFHLRPTAGTASGVHPVPFAYGRVYVHLDGPFSYEKWYAGLNAGRSFVTTGPLLYTSVDDQLPGTRMKQNAAHTSHVDVRVVNPTPLTSIELVRNGDVLSSLRPESKRLPSGAYEAKASFEVSFPASGWVAVRAIERKKDGRVRFAHTSPVYVDVAGKPLHPRKKETAYLIERVQSQIDRSRSVIKP